MQLAPKNAGKFTYADYVTWPDGERWELIDGDAYTMTPAPTSAHQRIAVRLVTHLEQALRGEPCVPFIAPTDVVLSEKDVVQPDVFVICDPDKITPANIQGAPDLVIEILAPSTDLKDRREKKALYERFGVREYLLVSPEGRYLERFFLEADGSYGKSEIFGGAEIVPLKSLRGLELSLSEVFEAAETARRPSPGGRVEG